MLLLQFKKEFVKSLAGTYPEGEVNSFFTLLVQRVLGLSRLEAALNPHRKLSATELEQLQEALVRLQKQEPIQYILGETEFFGLPFRVNGNVLIPRPETEELVEWILSHFSQQPFKAVKILDVGTGSGCIAISLAKNLAGSQVTGIDVSGGALETARTNAALNGVEVRFEKVDILACESLTDKYNIIVSNPPYVRELEKKEMQPNVLENEPAGALFVKDEDPLVFYEKITRLAKDHLLPNGLLFFEINQYLGPQTAALLTKNNFNSSLKKDIFGNDRMLKGEFITNHHNEN